MFPSIPYLICRNLLDSCVDLLTRVCKRLRAIDPANCVPFSSLHIFNAGKGKDNPYGA